jgi:hypothetical protein
MMEAARTSETSGYNYFTRQYIPEDNSELHTRRREDLKSHFELLVQLSLSKTFLSEIWFFLWILNYFMQFHLELNQLVALLQKW